VSAPVSKGQVFTYRNDGGQQYVRVRSKSRPMFQREPPTWTCDVLVLERRESSADPLRIAGIQRTPVRLHDEFLRSDRCRRVPELEQ
jgi:hypothetical protein